MALDLVEEGKRQRGNPHEHPVINGEASLATIRHCRQRLEQALGSVDVFSTVDLRW
jgi:hypothetical protein